MDNTLINASEIFETEDYTEANKYIALGWTLIDTYTKAYDNSGPSVKYQWMNYCFAWLKDDKPVHPEPKYKIESSFTF